MMKGMSLPRWKSRSWALGVADDTHLRRSTWLPKLAFWRQASTGHLFLQSIARRSVNLNQFHNKPFLQTLAKLQRGPTRCTALRVLLYVKHETRPAILTSHPSTSLAPPINTPPTHTHPHTPFVFLVLCENSSKASKRKTSKQVGLSLCYTCIGN